ncbi:hypothetical protein [Maridesulfovibrio sp.]|uniref:hypothetical protein n=1 Tax=Maridesulfovibrio sp. TaxID=2795000 RepID=UPI002AA6DD83|nr:hypothetical protein [Maridesulfovibrio sp.]
MPKDCEKLLKKKSHILEDRKTGSKASVRLENKAQTKFTVIEFDGCKMENQTACDYVVTTEKQALYVELKGSDVRKAHKQVLVAANYYKKSHSSKSKIGIIAFTGRPKESSFIQTQKRALMLKHKLKIICERSPVTHKL